MKIKIGPYRRWFGPYQLARFLCFWYQGSQYDEPDYIHNFGEKLSNIKPLNDFLTWVDSKKKRKVKIHIDNYDTWNMDSTLAMIILPMLVQLSNKKLSYCLIDDEDVPEDIRSDKAPPKENEWDVDIFAEKRADWVFSELIWTFQQLQPDYDWESEYTKGSIDIKFDQEKNDSGLYNTKLLYSDDYSYDKEGYEAHQKRISKGLILFGKYYRGLWD